MATILSAGDLAVIGVNSDNPDAFSFVLLVDIDAGTEIFFTDNGVFSDGSFRANEGVVKYTASTAVSAGTVIEFTGIGGDFTEEDAGFALSASGDQVIAYQGTADTPTFIYAVQTNSTQFQATATTSNDSALPTGLTEGTSAVAVGSGAGAGSEFDNSTYNESTTSGTRAELLAAISNAANWDGNNSRIANLADGPFTVTDAGGGGGTAPTYVEDFNNFTGSGFAPDPATGQLDSDAWSVTGLSDGDLDFGGTEASGDFARGTSTGGVSSGGVYSFEVESGNSILGVQPTGSDFTPGEFILKLQNDGDSTVTEVDVDYVIRFLNDQGRGNSLNFSFSEDGNSFTSVDGLDFVTPEAADALGWQSVDRETTITGLDIAPDETFFLKWTGNDVSGGGSRDEYGIDDIQVTNLVAFEGDGGNGGGNGDIALISSIQGSGASSSRVGEVVTIEAIVVGDFQDGSGTDGDFNGFFVQEEDSDADNDPLTSEGLFIFDGNSPSVDVNAGDLVRVTGTVAEFFGETQLSSITNVEVVSGGNSSLATPATITFPVASTTTNSDNELIADLEAFEGMLVTVPEELTVADLFTFGRFGEVGLYADGRLETFTQANEPSVSGFQAYQDLAVRNTVIIDDGSTIQNPAVIPFEVASAPGDTTGQLDANDELRSGDTTTGLTGVVRFSRGSGGSGDSNYRINPTVDPVFVNDNPRPDQSPDVGGRLTVASFNVLNFFTSLDDERSRNNNPQNAGPNNLEPRGANDLTNASDSVAPSTQAQNDPLAEFNRQVDKLVAALSETEADIFSLIELENEFGDQNGDGQFAIDFLIDELNAEISGANYQFVDPRSIDPSRTFIDTGDAISVGLIYNANTVKIADGTTIEILTDSDLAALGADPGNPVFDGSGTSRAPLAATFEEISTGETFTVAVNHFKSKGSISPFGNNEGIGDGTGNNNEARLQAAQAVDAWLDTDPTGSGDDDFLIIGDLNAYGMEDPIQFLADEGYENQVQRFLGPDELEYSFAFPIDLDTSPQVQAYGALDYALANSSLAEQVTGAREWHINADEASIFDYNLEFRPQAQADNLYADTPFRSADHDPIVLGLNLASANAAPNATDDIVATAQDTAVAIATVDLLANDEDADGD
ncbi:MAG: ExeM/NucH family extracellular endonuclease, partial [Cyanobacteria bacterium J06626_14]